MSLEEDQVTRIALLLASQFERQRMFTSCGWFFDDFDRIEPKNNVKYAAQAVWLTHLATGVDLAPAALAYLAHVQSWRSGLTASEVYSQHMLEIAETPVVHYSVDLASKLKNFSAS